MGRLSIVTTQFTMTMLSELNKQPKTTNTVLQIL
jgi:hypothetical protein